MLYFLLVNISQCHNRTAATFCSDSGVKANAGNGAEEELTVADGM